MRLNDSKRSVWLHESDERFTEYYAHASQSVSGVARMKSIRESALRIARAKGLTKPVLQVADIGCGAGTQSIIWAELGHQVHGLDVNDPLLELARQRSKSEGLDVDFQLGSATKLPWADESMDVCLLLELLEHVSAWETCLHEATRILRPQGILLLSTTNWLCPIQQEFTLPLYSWYPAPLKRYFERLSVTTKPHLANFAKYPAVNWFSIYRLRFELRKRGLQTMDRFDVMDLPNKDPVIKSLVYGIRVIPPLRFFAHVATPGTMVFAIKNLRT